MTRKEIDKLRTFHAISEQKLELFNNMKDSVSLSDLFVKASKLTSVNLQMINASALKESAAASEQGNYITLLTRMTGMCKVTRQKIYQNH